MSKNLEVAEVSTVRHCQEPIKWSLHLPYKPLESALSRLDLLLERFPGETSRADDGKRQSQRRNDTAIVLHQTAGNSVLTGQTINHIKGP